MFLAQSETPLNLNHSPSTEKSNAAFLYPYHNYISSYRYAHHEENAEIKDNHNSQE